jgi:lambda repressor-like predicted transcriptional regulator
MKEYLSLRELATYASLSVKTLRSYLTHPRHPLPHYRMPRKILVSVTEFEAWLKRFRVEHQGQNLNQLVNDLMDEIQSDFWKRP